MEETNKISKVLDAEEQRDLLAALKSPGWKAFVKLADNILLDWSDQGMNPDMAKMDDGSVIKHVVKFNGMKKGVTLIINTMEAWKRGITK